MIVLILLTEYPQETYKVFGCGLFHFCKIEYYGKHIVREYLFYMYTHLIFNEHINSIYLILIPGLLQLWSIRRWIIFIQQGNMSQIYAINDVSSWNASSVYQ